MPKYSIIIPVYNVENVIQRCVDSILMQSVRDYEILLIDDCSSDKSAEICEKYRASNLCVKLIKQKQNRGVSFVRNLGLNQAQGKYMQSSPCSTQIYSDSP